MLKKMANLVVLAGLTLVAPLGQAKVYEIKAMVQILPLIDQNTLVVFDIDNTISRPKQTVGSDQWASNQIERFKTMGFDERTAKDKGVAQFAQVQLKTEVQPVEASTPALIQRLQFGHIQVVALTARPLILADRTIEQIQSLGLDLRRTAPLAPLSSNLGSEPTIYKNGIILVGPHNNKGAVLAQFIKSLVRQSISKIVFIDDKVSNVQNVNEALNTFTTPHFELRYAAADPEVKSFNSKIGDFQWKIFIQNGALISDSQAQQIIGAQ